MLEVKRRDATRTDLLSKRLLPTMGTVQKKSFFYGEFHIQNLFSLKILPRSPALAIQTVLHYHYQL